MPRRSAVLIPGSLLSREQLLAHGMSTRRLSGGDLTRVLPNYYTPTAAPASLNALCFRLQRTVIEGAVISHSTAAALLGMPLPWWRERGIGLLHQHGERHRSSWIVPSVLPERAASGARIPGRPLWRPPPLHCSVLAESRKLAGPHVCVHRTHPTATIQLPRLLVAHPVEVVCQLAHMLEADDLVILLDHLLGPESALPGTSPMDIAAFLAQRSSTRGAPTVRAALRLARPNVESPGETRLRLLLIRAGFPEPVPNHVVPDPDDPARTRRIDDGYPELKIGAEYQGDVHRTTKGRWREDEARRDSLTSVGWRLRMATARDIEHPARFLSGMRRAFLDAGAPAPAEQNWLGAQGRGLGRRCAPPQRAQRGDHTL